MIGLGSDKNNKSGEREVLKNEHSGLLSHILLSQLSPAEKSVSDEVHDAGSSMLAQQLHVLEMFSRVDQGVKNYAMSHLLELTPDILIRSLQAEMDKVWWNLSQAQGLQTRFNRKLEMGNGWDIYAMYNCQISFKHLNVLCENGHMLPRRGTLI